MIKTTYLIENTKINGKTLKLNTLTYEKLRITSFLLKLNNILQVLIYAIKLVKGIIHINTIQKETKLFYSYKM